LNTVLTLYSSIYRYERLNSVIPGSRSGKFLQFIRYYSIAVIFCCTSIANLVLLIYSWIEPAERRINLFVDIQLVCSGLAGFSFAIVDVVSNSMMIAKVIATSTPIIKAGDKEAKKMKWQLNTLLAFTILLDFVSFIALLFEERALFSTPTSMLHTYLSLHLLEIIQTQINKMKEKEISSVDEWRGAASSVRCDWSSDARVTSTSSSSREGSRAD